VTVQSFRVGEERKTVCGLTIQRLQLDRGAKMQVLVKYVQMLS